MIRQVISTIDEKIFIRLENGCDQIELNSNCFLFLNRVFVQKVNKYVKKKKVIDYGVLNKYIDFNKDISVEYQLANAILCHVYRKAQIEDREIVPTELKIIDLRAFLST